MKRMGKFLKRTWGNEADEGKFRNKEEPRAGDCSARAVCMCGVLLAASMAFRAWWPWAIEGGGFVPSPVLVCGFCRGILQMSIKYRCIVNQSLSVWLLLSFYIYSSPLVHDT